MKTITGERQQSQISKSRQSPKRNSWQRVRECRRCNKRLTFVAFGGIFSCAGISIATAKVQYVLQLTPEALLPDGVNVEMLPIKETEAMQRYRRSGLDRAKQIDAGDATDAVSRFYSALLSRGRYAEVEFYSVCCISASLLGSIQTGAR